MNKENKHNKIRKKCWDRALHSFGKAYLFDKRVLKYSRYVNLLKVFGIVTPIAIGATALGYGFNASILKYVITIAIPISVVQLIFSVFAVVFKWDDELSYSLEASQDYNYISISFKKLGSLPPDSNEELEKKFDVLKERHQARSQQDAKHRIKEWELRKGMRYALREFQKECTGCNTVPKSMKSTDCPVCGNFRNPITKKLRSWTKIFFVL